MERCATGEHRGDTLAETLAAVTAAAAGIISDEDPGWETMQAIVWSARDVWPHMCAPEPLSRYCWAPRGKADWLCQGFLLNQWPAEPGPTDWADFAEIMGGGGDERV